MSAATAGHMRRGVESTCKRYDQTSPPGLPKLLNDGAKVFRCRPQRAVAPAIALEEAHGCLHIALAWTDMVMELAPLPNALKQSAMPAA